MMPKRDEPWFASGRGIFRRDAGFQMMTAAATVNWQEDTQRIVDLLNAGEVALAASAPTPTKGETGTIVAKILAHRARAEKDGVACIAYQFVAYQYLDELLVAMGALAGATAAPSPSPARGEDTCTCYFDARWDVHHHADCPLSKPKTP